MITRIAKVTMKMKPDPCPFCKTKVVTTRLVTVVPIRWAAPCGNGGGFCFCAWPKYKTFRVAALGRRAEKPQDQEAEALKQDICSALEAMKHEGPRLAAMRVKEERDNWKEKYFTMYDLMCNATEIAEKREHERDEAVRLLRELADAAIHFCPETCAKAADFLQHHQKQEGGE